MLSQKNYKKEKHSNLDLINRMPKKPAKTINIVTIEENQNIELQG